MIIISHLLANQKSLYILEIFRNNDFSKIMKIFWKSKNQDFGRNFGKFSKISFFRKFSKIFWKSRTFFKLWRFFSTKNFANFLMNFFLNRISLIWKRWWCRREIARTQRRRVREQNVWVCFAGFRPNHISGTIHWYSYYHDIF